MDWMSAKIEVGSTRNLGYYLANLITFDKRYDSFRQQIRQ